MNDVKSFLGPMRVSFLILTPACVLLGLGTAVWATGGVSPVHFVITLIGAVAAHIGVNAFNEYFDFKSGLDFKTQRTPFSGGSGTLPEKPELARQALATAVVSAVVVCLVGLYFLRVRGLALLPLGIAGVLVVILYTPWIARNAFACLIAPGLGFGTLMVVGTHFALTGEYSRSALAASFVPFFLVSNLLFLNQFPDVDADRSVGRKNYPIVIGRKKSSVIYGAFLGLAFLSIVAAVVLGYLPPASLIGLAVLPVAVLAARGAWKHADDVKRLAPYMGLNVVINIVTPVLVAVGLLIA
jgi:1,4-dihydroxy-2-naphthoate polyprenyltransferase